MEYKATEKIDKYEIGDIVPTKIAVVWEKMYKHSPVEKTENKTKVDKPIVEEVVIEEVKPKKGKGFFKK